jgi:hypothetical protein
LGKDAMILLILKTETFLYLSAYDYSKFLKISFNPKCRIILGHSLKTIRDDWWLHTEVVFFPPLYTSLFVKSLREEK